MSTLPYASRAAGGNGPPPGASAAGLLREAKVKNNLKNRQSPKKEQHAQRRCRGGARLRRVFWHKAERAAVLPNLSAQRKAFAYDGSRHAAEAPGAARSRGATRRRAFVKLVTGNPIEMFVTCPDLEVRPPDVIQCFLEKLRRTRFESCRRVLDARHLSLWTAMVMRWP